MERTKAPLDPSNLGGVMQYEDVIELHRKLGRVSDHIPRQMHDTCPLDVVKMFMQRFFPTLASSEYGGGVRIRARIQYRTEV